MDPMAIISNLKQLQTAVLYCDFQRGCAGINGILDQLLERMHRSDDDLACGDLVDNILVKGLAEASIRWPRSADADGP